MAIRLQFEADARKAKQEVASLEKSVANIDNTTKKATKTAGQLVNAFAALGTVAVTLSGLAKTIDSFTRLNNRIALTTGRTRALIVQQQKLIAVSKLTRTNLDQTANLYSKLALNTSLSNKEALKLTETLQKAAKISGGSTSTTAGAITQLTQGLASGVLRGEELNSVLEGLPRVAQAIAKEVGVTVGGLRSLAAEGKITSATVEKALRNSASVIDKEYGQVTATISESMESAFNSVKAGLARIGKVFSSGGGNVQKQIQKVGDAIGNAFKNIAVTLRVAQTDFLLFRLELGSLSDAFKSFSIGSTFGAMISKIKSYTSNIGAALKPISNFLDNVKEMFYSAYMYVVGNSIWKDMINGVVSYAGKIFAAGITIAKFLLGLRYAFRVTLGLIGLSIRVFGEDAQSFFEPFLLAVFKMQVGMANLVIGFAQMINQMFGVTEASTGIAESIVPAKEKLKVFGRDMVSTLVGVADTFAGYLTKGVTAALSAAILAIPFSTLLLTGGFGRTLAGKLGSLIVAALGFALAGFSANTTNSGTGETSLSTLLSDQSNILFTISKGVSSVVSILSSALPANGFIGLIKSAGEFIAENIEAVLITALSAKALLSAFGLTGGVNPLGVIAAAGQSGGDIAQRTIAGPKIRELRAQTEQLTAALGGLNESYQNERVEFKQRRIAAKGDAKELRLVRVQGKLAERAFNRENNKIQTQIAANTKKLAVSSQLLDGAVQRMRMGLERLIGGIGRVAGSIGSLGGGFLGAGIGKAAAEKFGLDAGESFLAIAAGQTVGMALGAFAGQGLMTALLLGLKPLGALLWKWVAALAVMLKARLLLIGPAIASAITAGMAAARAALVSAWIAAQAAAAAAYNAALRAQFLIGAALAGVTMAGAFAVGLPLLAGAALAGLVAYAFSNPEPFKKAGTWIKDSFFGAVEWVTTLADNIGDAVQKAWDDLDLGRFNPFDGSLNDTFLSFLRDKGKGTTEAGTPESNDLQTDYNALLAFVKTGADGAEVNKKLLEFITERAAMNDDRLGTGVKTRITQTTTPFAEENGAAYLSSLSTKTGQILKGVLRVPMIVSGQTEEQMRSLIAIAVHELGHQTDAVNDDLSMGKEYIKLKMEGPDRESKLVGETQANEFATALAKTPAEFSAILYSQQSYMLGRMLSDVREGLLPTITSQEQLADYFNTIANNSNAADLGDDGKINNSFATTDNLVIQAMLSLGKAVSQFGADSNMSARRQNGAIMAWMNTKPNVTADEVRAGVRSGTVNTGEGFSYGGMDFAEVASDLGDMIPDSFKDSAGEITDALGGWIKKIWELLKRGIGMGGGDSAPEKRAIASIDELVSLLTPAITTGGITLNPKTLAKFFEDDAKAASRTLRLQDSLQSVVSKITELRDAGKEVPLELVLQRRALEGDILTELAKIAELTADVVEGVSKFNKRQEEAGFSMRDTAKSSLAGGIGDVLKGGSATDALAGIATAMRDEIVNNISTSFVEGLFTSADGKDNSLAGLFTGFGGNLAKSSEGLGRGAFEKGAGLLGKLGTPNNPMHVVPAGAGGAGGLFGLFGGDSAKSTSHDSVMGSIDDIAGMGSNEKGGTAGAKGGFGGVIDSVKNLGSTLLTDGFGGLGDVFSNIMGSLGQGLSSLFSGGGGAGLGGMLGTLLGGMFDNGGTVPSNKFGIVGERGPELVSGPAKVYNRAKTAREMQNAGNGGSNITFALEGDFDSRAERSIRSMVQSGTLQSAMNGAEIENGGSRPVFRTP